MRHHSRTRVRLSRPTRRVAPADAPPHGSPRPAMRRCIGRLAPAALAAVTLLLLPSPGLAHHAEWMQGQPFLQGLSMPLHGIDHLCVALAVGLVAAQLDGAALWVVPGLFGLLMLIGGLLNVNGIAMPLLEQGIMASSLILGAMLTRRRPLPILLASVVIGSFAVIQGSALFASAARPSVDWSLLRFSAGCLISALAVLGGGIALGLAFRSARRRSAFRIAGVATMAAGIVVYLSAGANEVVVRLFE